MRLVSVLAAIFTLSAAPALAQETASPAPVDPTSALNLDLPAEPAPPPKASYHEATLRHGFPRRGRVVREEGDEILVSFYTTGEERVKKDEVTLTVRRP